MDTYALQRSRWQRMLSHHYSNDSRIMLFLSMITSLSLSLLHLCNASQLDGTGVKGLATRVDNSITRAQQPTDGFSGEDTTRSIIGIMDSALIWKMIPFHSHDWLNTSFRRFLN